MASRSDRGDDQPQHDHNTTEVFFGEEGKGFRYILDGMKSALIASRAAGGMA
jgi:hypothetical protein